MDGITIPTLDQVIEQIKSQSDSVIFNLELKSAPEESGCFPDVRRYCDLVHEVLLRHQMNDRVFLQSFDWRLVYTMKTLMPDLLTGYLTDNQPNGAPRSPRRGIADMWTNYNDLNDYNGDIPLMVRESGGAVWSANYLDLHPQEVARAHELGIEVYVWTVNEAEDMQRMIEWEVDVIITDFPDRAFELIE